MIWPSFSLWQVPTVSYSGIDSPIQKTVLIANAIKRCSTNGERLASLPEREIFHISQYSAFSGSVCDLEPCSNHILTLQDIDLRAQISSSKTSNARSAMILKASSGTHTAKSITDFAKNSKMFVLQHTYERPIQSLMLSLVERACKQEEPS